MANLDAIKEFLSEETYAKVCEELKEKDVFVGNGQYIPKSRFDEVNNKLKDTDALLNTTKADLEAKTKSLEETSKQVVDVDSLKNEYQAKIDTLTKDLNTTKKTFEVKSALQESSAKHIDLLMTKVDVNSLTDADSIKNCVEDLKKNYADLFVKETAPTKVGGQPQTDTRAIENETRRKLGLKPI